MEEVNIASLATKFLARHLEGLISSISKETSTATGRLRAQLESTFSGYLDYCLNRYGKAKSFLARSEPMPLYSFFVPPNLSNAQRELASPTMGELATQSPHSVILGSGGSGKSMLMRHLLVSCIDSSPRLPILIELRSLNGSEQTIEQLILDGLTPHTSRATPQLVRGVLNHGKACLLLDGFDEVEQGARKRIADEIHQLCEKHQDTWISVSSRPDITLEGWEGFTSYSVVPLDLEKAAELVRLAPVDQPTKDRFTAALQADLFNSHESFLSNPLLLSIMLLTYRDNASIPKKISLFYSQAYESLFHQHDALKGGFQRERKSSLDIQDFSRAFSAFCFITASNGEFSFSRTDALNRLDEAKQASNIDFKSPHLLDDSIQAACLLLEDGLDITFTHRSFQEYFSARFVQTCAPRLKKKLVSQLSKQFRFSGTINLLLEMDQMAMEEHYVIPAIETLKKEINYKRSVGVTHHLRYIKSLFLSFGAPATDSAGLGLTMGIKNLGLFLSLQTIYFRYRQPPQAPPPIPDMTPAEHLVAESGYGSSVQASSLKVRSRFTEALREDPGLTGISFVRELIAIGDRVRDSHQGSAASINEILSG